jgi:glutamate 5-kinase
VIKVGTTTLTYPSGKLNFKRINRLAWMISDLRNQGKEVILVSSGAVAVGVARLGLLERPRDIIGRQAASAVGQAALMQIYENFFGEYNQKVAQILLTKDVVEHEARRRNAENTFFRLLSLGVTPIVNENDSVSTDELDFSFSENDTLSAYVALLTAADLLIMLSDIDGMYDSDPKTNPDAKIIRQIGDVAAVMKFAGDSQSAFGTGGMASKLSAAHMAAQKGIDTVIASGDDPAVVFDIVKGIDIGTYIRRYE